MQLYLVPLYSYSSNELDRKEHLRLISKVAYHSREGLGEYATIHPGSGLSKTLLTGDPQAPLTRHIVAPLSRLLRAQLEEIITTSHEDIDKVHIFIRDNEEHSILTDALTQALYKLAIPLKSYTIGPTLKKRQTNAY
jgi:hypothetical protein